MADSVGFPNGMAVTADGSTLIDRDDAGRGADLEVEALTHVEVAEVIAGAAGDQPDRRVGGGLAPDFRSAVTPR